MIKKKDLIKIIAKALNISPSKISEKTKSEDIEEWDSLGRLSIISAIHKKLGKNANLNGLPEAKSVKKIITILIKNKQLK